MLKLTGATDLLPATRQSVRTLYKVRVAHSATLKFLLVPWQRCEWRQLDFGDCGERSWSFLGFWDPVVVGVWG